MVCQAAKGERFEFALGDHDGNSRVEEESTVDTRHDIQHVGPAGRAEILLPKFEDQSRLVVPQAYKFPRDLIR